MIEEQAQQDQQTADRTTVFCLISLVIGAYIIWANLDQNTPDPSSTALPMAVVGIVHLLGAGIALYHARKTHHFIRNIHVYTYFPAVLVLALWLLFNGGLPA